jgi:predicted DsbA family dithiol-disulfide isomerase
VGLDRSAALRELGVSVVTLPLEIHPEIPIGGLALEERWAGRYREAMEMYERIEAECEAAGLPFRRPARVPNTRRALETAEWARHQTPDFVDALERSMFEAQFVDQRPLDDPDVIDELVASAGADPAEARRAVDAGEVRDAMQAAAIMAASVGVRATPTWLIGNRALVPGVAPRRRFAETVSRLTSEPETA